jgi:hypothetical protein
MVRSSQSRLKVKQGKWNGVQKSFEKMALCCLRKIFCGMARKALKTLRWFRAEIFWKYLSSNLNSHQRESRILFDDRSKPCQGIGRRFSATGTRGDSKR